MGKNLAKVSAIAIFITWVLGASACAPEAPVARSTSPVAADGGGTDPDLRDDAWTEDADMREDAADFDGGHPADEADASDEDASIDAEADAEVDATDGDAADAMDEADALSGPDAMDHLDAAEDAGALDGGGADGPSDADADAAAGDASGGDAGDDALAPDPCADVVCSLPNASALCTDGVCAVGSCNSGFSDCNGSAADGCEAHLATDLLNCGVCAGACDLPHAESSCSLGECLALYCDPGAYDCDGDLTNGCELCTRTVLSGIDMPDWVRAYPSARFRDATLLADYHGAVSLAKWRLDAVPSSSVSRAVLHLYNTNPDAEDGLGAITLWNVEDDSWTSLALGSTLYNWPTAQTIAVYPDTQEGWIAIDLTAEIAASLAAADTVLSLKWTPIGNATEGYATPYAMGALRPWLEVYSSP